MGVAAPCNYEMFDCEARKEEGLQRGVNSAGVAALPLQRIHLLQKKRETKKKDLHATRTLPVNLTESLHLPAALDPATLGQYAADNRPAGSA